MINLSSVKSMAWKSRRWCEGLFTEIWQGFLYAMEAWHGRKCLQHFFQSARMVKRSQEESTVKETMGFTE